MSDKIYPFEFLPSNKADSANKTYKRLTDNYLDMLVNAFENWPNQTGGTSVITKRTIMRQRQQCRC